MVAASGVSVISACNTAIPASALGVGEERPKVALERGTKVSTTGDDGRCVSVSGDGARLMSIRLDGLVAARHRPRSQRFADCSTFSKCR